MRAEEIVVNYKVVNSLNCIFETSILHRRWSVFADSHDIIKFRLGSPTRSHIASDNNAIATSRNPSTSVSELATCSRTHGFLHHASLAYAVEYKHNKDDATDDHGNQRPQIGLIILVLVQVVSCIESRGCLRINDR